MKSFGFQLNPNVIGYNLSIRDKGDIIKLLINILRYLNFNKPIELANLTIEADDNKILLIIHIDKMSRLFIVEKNKIHSFQFPFKISISQDSCNIKYNDTIIDSATISLFSAVFSTFKEYTPLEEILDKYWNAISDLGVDAQEAKSIETLITYLLTFETGYLRYDYDEIRGNEMHPVNHFDFYYSSNNTFKIGLTDRIEYRQLIEILDINKKCTTIKI